MSGTPSVGQHSEITLYPVDAKAQKYRGLTKSELKEEKIVKTSLTALGIILLIAVIVGVHSLATSGDDFAAIFGGMQVGIFGGTFGLAALISGLVIDYGAKYGSQPNFEHVGTKSEITLTFKEGKLRDVKKRFHNKEGGLVGPVQHGLITPKQADKLHKIFEKLDKIDQELQYFKTTYNKAAIDRGDKPAPYVKLVQERHELFEKWKKMRGKIQKQYASGSQPEGRVVEVQPPSTSGGEVRGIWVLPENGAEHYQEEL